MRTASGGLRHWWRAGLRAPALVLAVMLTACSGDDGILPINFAEPETAVSYDVELTGSPSDEVTELAEQSLSSYRFQDKGVASLAFLRRRAESDVPTLLKILRSRGYYSATAAVTVEETEPDKALVTIAVEPGVGYTLTRHDLVIEQTGQVAPPALNAADFGSPVGGLAEAAPIAEAEAAAVLALRNRGFPYAEYQDRQGVADPKAGTLTVTSRITAGPSYIFGPVTFEGVERIDEDYLLTYRPWDDGDSFDTADLAEFQRRLFATELFAAATVRPPETPPEGSVGGGPLPVTVVVEEGPRRRIEGGLRYDTDLGPNARVAFQHRNLFGANERLLIQAEGGLIEQTVGIGVRKPQFGRPGQDLLTDLTFLRTTDDAFDAESVTAFAGLERKFGKKWTGGLGGLAEVSLIDDSGEETTAYLLGAPVFAAYDGSNSLLDPTKGTRMRLAATPFLGIQDQSDAEFLVLDATGSAYFPLDDAHHYVIAARGRAASILSPGLDVIPATRRLYSGGSGSVRGYQQDFVGPLDSDGDPVGGRSALEAGLEFRARLYGDIGGVIFAEAGSVSTEVFPDFAESIQAAAGLGLRYHSPAGPIRLDVAFPVNGRAEDDTFQFYFSIGQAF